ncbi:MAG TPA: MBL fold metallo-hydrolase [Puia sp.]|nr:MBL fold metallo-hydrolase [Puia sp.]
MKKEFTLMQRCLKIISSMPRMLKFVSFCLLFCLVFGKAALAQQHTKKEYDIKKLAEGVYSFTWKDPLQNPIEGNSLFIINESDVVVVDACQWPSSAQTMINELKKLTPKPVRYVINSHWHDDHVQGNFLYKQNWPDVEFIGHINTRTDLTEQTINKFPTILKRFKDEKAVYEKWIKDGKDPNGKELDSARKKRIQDVIDFYDETYDEYSHVKYVLPDLLISDSIVLYRGDRVIKVLWLGRGNTRGDVVTFLPKEKIAATGDLVVYPIPFAFGSYYKEWIEALGRLEALDANIYMPGHGFVEYDKGYVRQVKDLLTDLLGEVNQSVKEGMTLEETKKKVLLPDWKKKFAGDDLTRQRAFDDFFLAPGVEGAWHQAKGDKEGELHER